MLPLVGFWMQLRRTGAPGKPKRCVANSPDTALESPRAEAGGAGGETSPDEDDAAGGRGAQEESGWLVFTPCLVFDVRRRCGWLPPITAPPAPTQTARVPPKDERIDGNAGVGAWRFRHIAFHES